MLTAYLLLINAAALILMLADKKKAIHKKWRIPEFTLLTVAFFGGSIGMMLGMHLFRHKTKHPKFTIGIPLIMAFQIIVAVILYTT